MVVTASTSSAGPSICSSTCPAQRLPLHWPRGTQDTAWAQGVLGNRLTASIALPVHAAGLLQLRLQALQRGLMFDGAALHDPPCR